MKVSQTLRFWFRNSERYQEGPYTMVGILATSWDEAKMKVCGPLASLPIAQKLLCLPPEHYFLSCNVLECQALPDEDQGVEVSIRTYNEAIPERNFCRIPYAERSRMPV